MRLDTKQALRPVLCLPNPSRMQAARWERAGFRGARAVPPEYAGREVGSARTNLRRSPFGEPFRAKTAVEACQCWIVVNA